MGSIMPVLVSGAVRIDRKGQEPEYYLFVLNADRSHLNLAQGLEFRGLTPSKLSCEQSVFDYVTEDIQYPASGTIKLDRRQTQGKSRRHVLAISIFEKIEQRLQKQSVAEASY